MDELKTEFKSDKNELLDEKTEIGFMPTPLNNNFLEIDLMAVATAPYTSTRNKRSKQTEKASEEFTDLMAPIFSNDQRNELNAKATSALKVKRNADKVDHSKKKPFSFTNTKGEINSIFSQIESAKRNKLTRSDIRKLAKKALALATLQKVKAKEETKQKGETLVRLKSSPKKNKIDKKNTTRKQNMKKSPKSQKKKRVDAKSKVSDKTTTSKKRSKSRVSDIPGLNAELSDTLTNAKNSHSHKNVEISDTKMANSIEKNKEGIRENNAVRKEDNLAGNDEIMKSQILSVAEEEATSHIGETAGINRETTSASKKSEFSEDLTKSTKNDQSEFKEQSIELSNFKNTSSATEMTPATFSNKNGNQENHNFSYDEKKSIIEKPKIVNEDDVMSSEKRNSIDQRSSIINDTYSPADKSTIETLKIDEIKSALQHTLSLENFVDSDIAKFTKKNEMPSEALEEKIDSLKSVLLKANENKVPNKFLTDLPAGLRMIAWKELIKKKKIELNELEAIEMDRKKVATKPVTIDIDINQDKIDDNTVTQLFKTSTQPIENGEKKISETINLNDLGIANGGKHEAKELSNLDQSSEEKDDNLSSRHVKYLKKHIKSARSLRKLIAKTLVGHCKSTGKRILEAFVAMDKALERAQAIAEVIGQKFHVNTDLINNLVDDKEDEVVETFLRDIFTKLDK